MTDPESAQACREFGLTPQMVGVLGTGHPSSHSARVIGHAGVIKALQRRGLIGTDRRWTRLGFDVAARVLSGKVKTIDELHADAQAEMSGIHAYDEVPGQHACMRFDVNHGRCGLPESHPVHAQSKGSAPA